MSIHNTFSNLVLVIFVSTGGALLEDAGKYSSGVNNVCLGIGIVTLLIAILMNVSLKFGGSYND